jgi:DNA sulfur modification protein DndC
MSSRQQDRLLMQPGYLDEIRDRIRGVYRSQEADWVVAFSGNRGATATLQLIWEALEGLDEAALAHRVHVVNVTTGVDSVVAHSWISRSLLAMETAAEDHGLPISAARLTRELADSFWVRLIGRGDRPPNPNSRWCAEGLKRRPVERYIRRLTRQGRRVVLVLNSQGAEGAHSRVSSLRHASEAGLRAYRGQADALRYSPLHGWSAADIHSFLNAHSSPWDTSNLELLRLYETSSQAQSAHAPLCGDCRVGCWVCTVLDGTCPSEELFEQRPDLVWLAPLFKLREELSLEGEFVDPQPPARTTRDGRSQGAYNISGRGYWLRRVLKTQREVQELLPRAEEMTLISVEELREIRRIWRVEAGVRDDRIERIYRDILGEPFPKSQSRPNTSPTADEPDLLREAFGGDEESYRLSRSLLDVERDYRTMIRRAGVYEALSGVLGEEDAPADQSCDGLGAEIQSGRAPGSDKRRADAPAAGANSDERA